jgi:hypothetical protein
MQRKADAVTQARLERERARELREAQWTLTSAAQSDSSALVILPWSAGDDGGAPPPQALLGRRSFLQFNAALEARGGAAAPPSAAGASATDADADAVSAEEMAQRFEQYADGLPVNPRPAKKQRVGAAPEDGGGKPKKKAGLAATSFYGRR